MENLKRVASNEDALRRFREQSRIAAAKDRVVHAALNAAAKRIVALYGPNISLDASKDNLTEIRQGVFSGTVDSQLSMETSAGLKRINFPIEIRASQAVFGTDLQLKASISTALGKVASEEDKKAKECEARFDENVAALKEAEEETNQITAYMEAGMSLEEATSKVFNLSAALKSEAKLDKIVDSGMDNQANIGINSCPQAYITVDANNLPPYDAGDILDVAGVAYECIGKEGAFLKFKVKMD